MSRFFSRLQDGHATEDVEASERSGSEDDDQSDHDTPAKKSQKAISRRDKIHAEFIRCMKPDSKPTPTPGWWQKPKVDEPEGVLTFTEFSALIRVIIEAKGSRYSVR